MADKIEALLIDLSGTLHIGDKPITSAISALQSLREHNIPFRLCSNTSASCTQTLVSKLRGMGFDIREEELWTSLGAMRDWLEVSGIRRPYFIVEPDAHKEFKQFQPQVDETLGESYDSYDAVCLAHSPSQYDYDKLNTAFRILVSNSRADKPLLTTHAASCVRASDGYLSLGPGPFVHALENAASTAERKVEAKIVGKPTKAFFERVLASFNNAELESPERASSTKWKHVAIIGDDVKNDLGGGALELGLYRVLVRSGKYRLGDENPDSCAPDPPPDEVHDTFAQFVENLLSQKNATELERRDT